MERRCDTLFHTFSAITHLKRIISGCEHSYSCCCSCDRWNCGWKSLVFEFLLLLCFSHVAKEMSTLFELAVLLWQMFSWIQRSATTPTSVPFKKHVTAIIVTSTAWQWPQSLTAVSSHVSSLHMQWSVSICNSSSSFWMQWYRRVPKHATTAERTLAVVYNVTWYYSTAQPFSVDQSAKVLWANTNLSAYLTVICRGLHTVIHYDH